MGYVSKEGYFYKQLAAEKKMEENARIKTLTEEQHNALAEICYIRHHLHCNWESLFNAESANFNELFDQYDSINDILTSANLPPIQGLPDSDEEIITTIDYEADDEGMNFTDWYDSHIEEAYYQWEDINNKIEAYLRNIDALHGTKYEPTGSTRLY